MSFLLPILRLKIALVLKEASEKKIGRKHRNPIQLKINQVIILMKYRLGRQPQHDKLS